MLSKGTSPWIPQHGIINGTPGSKVPMLTNRSRQIPSFQSKEQFWEIIKVLNEITVLGIINALNESTVSFNALNENTFFRNFE